MSIGPRMPIDRRLPIAKGRPVVGLLAPPAMVATFRRASRHRAPAEKQEESS